MRPLKHVVSVSGGKDSEATALVARESIDPVVPREDLIYVFADTGNEHRLTYDHIDYLETVLGKIHRLRANFDREIAGKRAYVLEHWPEKGVPPLVVERAARALVASGNPYLDLCLWKGRFPSRKAQFCTEFLKTTPLVEFQMALIDEGNDVWSWQGVRRNESATRRYAKEFEEVGGGLYIYRPIVRWQAADTFDAMREAGVKHNPLYEMGMTRVGCMPCINAAKDEILEIARRFPEEIDRIAEWETCVALASKRGETSFFPNPERDAHLDKRGIYKVVRWAQTSRGGRQYNLFRQMDDEPDTAGPSCKSSYGLCE